jgi:hypothetical protein
VQILDAVVVQLNALWAKYNSGWNVPLMIDYLVSWIWELKTKKPSTSIDDEFIEWVSKIINGTSTWTTSQWWEVKYSNRYPWCDTDDIKIWKYTISACNVWASKAWLEEESYWSLFQWWNNYGFSNSWSITTSSTKVSWTVPIPYSFPAFITSWNNTISLQIPNRTLLQILDRRRIESYKNYFSYDEEWTWTITAQVISNWISPEKNYTWPNNDLWWWYTKINTLSLETSTINKKWPCAEWYHIPTKDEWLWMIDEWWWKNNYVSMINSLKLPLSGARDNKDASILEKGSVWHYWTSWTAWYWSDFILAENPSKTGSFLLYHNNSNSYDKIKEKGIDVQSKWYYYSNYKLTYTSNTNNNISITSLDALIINSWIFYYTIENSVTSLNVTLSGINYNPYTSRDYWYSVRCFKN